MPRRPQVVAFDAIETVFSLDPLRDRLVTLGLPPHALEVWFARTLRDGLLAACRELDGIPECYAVVDGRPVPVARAQPVQAWSAGAVLHLLSIEAEPDGDQVSG